jgi:hypothetical protein
MGLFGELSGAALLVALGEPSSKREQGVARRALAQARYSATFQTFQIQLRRLQPSTLFCTVLIHHSFAFILHIYPPSL